ncbi:MAG: hypothetical protein Q9219_007242 [cf. Caloplaca sp. 3 TL-2023]
MAEEAVAEKKETSGGSLADRLTKADGSKFQSPKADPENTSTEDAPSKPSGDSDSWADEVETPVKATPEPPTKPSVKPEESSLAKAQLDGATESQQGGALLAEESSLAKAQLDGATEPQQGGPLLAESSYEVNVKLSDVQANPDNPLYSIKNFNELGLSENIIKGIYEMRFVKPSKIQEKALPLLLANPPVNMIGQSQSGTGKTAAFVLNILSRIDLTTPGLCDRAQALVLAPSRELARQIMGVVQVMGRHMDGLRVVAAIPADKENRGKSLNGQIVVGTPGTTMDLIKKRLINAFDLKVLVLDEADNMLEQQGLGDQCIRVKRMLPKNIQVVLFSATFPDTVVQYAELFAPNANQITLKHEELTVSGIKQLYLEYARKPFGVNAELIGQQTRATALEVERRMNAEGHQCACLTGEYTGQDRDLIIDAFRGGQAKVLITTNVLSRGIDIQSVSLVVNYIDWQKDLPDKAPTEPHRADTQTYLHRIGRTGRFGRVGVAISFMSGQRDWHILNEIQDYFGVEMIGLDINDWDNVEQRIKAVLKSSRAQANFRPETKDVNM